MDISAGLIAKGTLGLGALAAAGGAGYNYRDKIGDFLSSFSKKVTPANAEVTNDNATLNAKIKALGIENCELENTKSVKECELNKEGFEKINFLGKGESNFTVTDLGSDKKVTLKIEKGYEETDFPGKLRFTFKNPNTEDVEIGSDTSSKIILKQGVNYDFKIKDSTKLEKAWTLVALAKKVGITCTNETGGECDLGSGINVWKEEADHITDASADSGKKINVAKDSAGYNGGFKLTVSEEITLNGGDKKKSNNGVGNLTNSNMSYEIDARDKDGKKTWFLIEKAVSVGA